jgi:hypothetical protein
LAVGPNIGSKKKHVSDFQVRKLVHLVHAFVCTFLTNALNFFSKNIIKEIEEMHQLLLGLANAPIIPTINELKDVLVRKVFEFIENMRNYVEAPSSTMLLCDEYVRNCMAKKGNCYSLLPTAALIEYFRASKV